MATLVASKNAQLEPSKRDALEQALNAAEEAAAGIPDCPPALAPVTVAQFLLESNWGRAGMGDAHNYFGIKARPGEPFVTKTTTEFVKGQPVTVDIHNDTDTPEQLHWHGQFLSTDVDGSAEEGTPFVPARGSRRTPATSTARASRPKPASTASSMARSSTTRPAGS